MISWSRPRLLLFLYALFAAVGALGAATPVLRAGSTENAVLLGLSLPRLALVVFLLLVAGLFGRLAISFTRNAAWAERASTATLGSEAGRARVLWIALGLFLIGWIGSSLPGYRLEEGLSDYFLRLRPLMFWLASIGAAGLLLLLVESRYAKVSSPLAETPALLAAAAALALFLLIWLLMAVTGLGIRIREDYWYGAGVPALPLQILFSLALALLFLRFESRLNRTLPRQLDWILVLLIWGLTAFAWAREPLRPTFFMPGPSVPNHDFYPFSDASLFDVGSQFALIGQGILNGNFFDRVLYMAFLTYLHALVGQNFTQLTAAQAAIFAVFPSIIYLLGRELQGRALGVSAAALAALRGVNAIAAATWIDLASPKMLLTDFPTAIGIALLTLVFVRWLKEPGKNLHLSLWVGGVLGLTLMVRTHVLLALPAISLYMLTRYRFAWRPWALASTLLIIGMLSATMPWDLRSHVRGAPLFSIYFERILLVLKVRYHWPPGETRLPGPPVAVATTRDPIVLPNGARTAAAYADRCQSMLCSGLNHLFHNFSTSVLIFPTSPALDDLRYTVKEGFPYWRQDWRGQGVAPPWFLFLSVNLGLIALGAGLAWARLRWAGLAPFFVFVVYMLSNALAQTSGGRYIVPADWILSLYFLLGSLVVVRWLLGLLGWQGLSQQDDPPAALTDVGGEIRLDFQRSALVVLAILLVGSLIPLAELPFPRLYPIGVNRQQALTTLQSGSLLQGAGLDVGALDRFLASTDATIAAGRALYPRYFEAGRGLTASDYPFAFMDFPRLTFTFLVPAGQNGVILPGNVPSVFPNAADVIVLGCRTGKYIDALAVFLPAQGAVYTRSPASPLECPLRQPVCFNKETCY